MAWNRDLINQQKNELQKEFEQTHNQDLLYYIASLDAILDFDNYQHFYVSPDFQLAKRDNLNTIYIFESFLPDIEAAAEQDRFYTNVLAKRLSNKFVEEDEILSFTNDFFKQLDKELYDIFSNIYKNRHDNFQKSNKRDSAFTISGIDYSYINIEETNTIDEYFDSTHEYGHAIQDTIYFRDYGINNYPFHELLAFFSQYLSLLYYERLHPEDIEDIKRYKHILLLSVLNNIKKIMYYYNYSSNFNNSTKIGMLINLKRINKISFQTASKTINSSLFERFIYSISFLTLIELLYTDDLEKSIYIVKKLIRLPKKDDYICDLAAYEINLTEHLRDFIKYTEKNHDSKILHI